MQYFEDIMELIEDIPEEICKRFELMRKWDSDVERLQLECRYAVKRILELTETSETMREKILMELADKYRLIHRLSERKLELAVRSERLMSAVLDKVNDSSYLCKIELEVDNPGCTDAIERNFCRMLGLRPTSSHLAKCNVEFEPLDDVESTSSFQEEDIFGGCSPSDSRDGAFSNMSNGTADMERLESFSQRSVSCGNPPSSLASAPKFKRRKYQTGTSQPTMLNQLRKKQLEKLKDSKVNAARKDGCRENQQKVPLTLAESEIASYYKSENDTARIAVRTEDLDPSVDDYWKEQDTLGSEDDLNANEFMDLFPVALPSPPRELLESLQEDAFPDDNHITYEPHSKDCPQSPTLPGIFMDSFQSSPSQSPSVSLWDKKKRTGVSFANVNETTSLHGRTRKMTERAVELLQNHKDREKLKRKVDAVETEASEQWCFCREGSSGSMICCDDPECKYQWFHFECVGLAVEPKGQWFCSECSGKWH